MGFYPAFGNVAQAGFTAAWRGAEAQSFRRRMAAPVQACAGCEAIDSCVSACPRRSLAESGDVATPTQRSCETARLLHGFAELDDNRQEN